MLGMSEKALLGATKDQELEVQVAKDGSIAAVGSEAVAAEISRSGTPVLAANVKMDEITELGASTKHDRHGGAA